MQLGVNLPNVNSTRLKEKLLAEIPELDNYKSGREIHLAFKNDVGQAITEASTYSDAMLLAKAAQILRNRMLEHKQRNEGNLNETSIYDSLPSALLQFVCMIEHGADIQSQLRYGATPTDLAMAQLLQYNCFSQSTEDCRTHRHSRDREPPFPIYVGMAVHAKTRKRHLVDMLHEHGLSIPYKRVLDISTQLGDAAVTRYVEDGVVCPPKLRKGLFSTSAIDNIDHNPSASTAKSSFHGTSMSLFQHSASK